MRDSALKFLVGVLGTEGAQALRRTTDRAPDLEPVLVPRAALAWLAGRAEYEGLVPGQQNSYLSFAKSDQGYTGVVSLPEQNYEFSQAPAEHLAAAIAVAVGTLGPARPSVRDLTLARLGRSIDALAKAQDLVKALPAALKTELPGQTAKPREQQEPQGPQAPVKQPKMAKPRLPKLKVPALKVEKSELGRDCPACGGAMFAGTRFTGCICFADIAKSVSTVVYNDGVVLEFGPGFPAAALPLLRKALK